MYRNLFPDFWKKKQPLGLHTNLTKTERKELFSELKRGCGRDTYETLTHQVREIAEVTH